MNLIINFLLRTSLFTSTSYVCEQRTFRLFPSSKRDITCLDWCKSLKDVSTSSVVLRKHQVSWDHLFGNTTFLHLSVPYLKLNEVPKCLSGGSSLEWGASETCPGILLHYLPLSLIMSILCVHRFPFTKHSFIWTSIIMWNLLRILSSFSV